MARGPKRHLKRLFAPKDWMLSKLTGVYAPRPRAGPHKLRESLPLLIVLRNRLKYALNSREASMILRQKMVKVDGRPRTDPKYPAGFMDVIDIPLSGDRFRVMYDVKGRFTLTKVSEAEANIKLCKVMNTFTTTGRVPVVTTHDGRRIRYADHLIQVGDTVVVDVKEGKITDYIKLRPGKIVICAGGANRGRVGEITKIERHPGSFNIVHIRDKNQNEFATRLRNVFVIGTSYDNICVTLPKENGLKTDVIEERSKRLVDAEERKLAQQNRQRKAARRI